MHRGGANDRGVYGERCANGRGVYGDRCANDWRMAFRCTMGQRRLRQGGMPKPYTEGCGQKRSHHDQQLMAGGDTHSKYSATRTRSKNCMQVFETGKMAKSSRIQVICDGGT
jgi:hypothetical protein